VGARAWEKKTMQEKSRYCWRGDERKNAGAKEKIRHSLKRPKRQVGGSLGGKQGEDGLAKKKALSRQVSNGPALVTVAINRKYGPLERTVWRVQEESTPGGEKKANPRVYEGRWAPEIKTRGEKGNKRGEKT